MKKIVLMVVVMAIATPAMAELTFTLTPGVQPGTVVIGYANDSGISLDDDPRGIALTVTLTNGTNATIEPGAADVSLSPYNCYIDHLYSVPTDGLGDGGPLAENGGPGKLETGAAVVSLSFGYLDEGGLQEAVDDAVVVLATIEVSGDALSTVDVTLSADTTRGPSSGVVGSEIDSTMPPTLVGLVLPVTDCYPTTDTTRYDLWVSVDKPKCWCWARQCKGDANGDLVGSLFAGYTWVGTTDLGIFGAAWNVMEPTKGPGMDTIVYNGVPGICADFNHDLVGSLFAGYTHVGTTDLALFGTNWNVMEPTKGPGVPGDECPGDIDPSGPDRLYDGDLYFDP